MPKTISGAVGRNGRNFPPVDVVTVQYLLNCVPAGQGGPSPELAVDGAAGPKTIAAIEKFQRATGALADGRVDPGGNTLRALQQRDPYPNQAVVPAGTKGGFAPPAGKSSAGDPFGIKGRVQPNVHVNQGAGGNAGKGMPGQPGARPNAAPPFAGKTGLGQPPGKTGPGGSFGNNTGFGLPPGKTSAPFGGNSGPGGKGF